jgi:hypothetical protein
LYDTSDPWIYIAAVVDLSPVAGASLDFYSANLSAGETTLTLFSKSDYVTNDTLEGLSGIFGVGCFAVERAELGTPGIPDFAQWMFQGAIDSLAVYDALLDQATLQVHLDHLLADPEPPVQWSTEVGGNGHWYAAVYDPNGITWDEANDAASVSGGYLATITSAAENEFVFQLADASDTLWSRSQVGVSIGPWLGGWQPEGSSEPDGGWRWVTDEPFSYTNWLPGEPNDITNAGTSWPGDGILFWDRTSGWNDYPNVGSLFGYGYEGWVTGYMVEYVPEPASLSLFSLGGLILIRRQR